VSPTAVLATPYHRAAAVPAPCTPLAWWGGYPGGWRVVGTGVGGYLGRVGRVLLAGLPWLPYPWQGRHLRMGPY